MKLTDKELPNRKPHPRHPAMNCGTSAECRSYSCDEGRLMWAGRVCIHKGRRDFSYHFQHIRRSIKGSSASQELILSNLIMCGSLRWDKKIF